jgi:tripartite-type tricarboxylate transporter receptor subunit TctC
MFIYITKFPSIFFILVGLIFSLEAYSQINTPQKPIKFVVITAPGGGGDQSARIVADQLAIKLNRIIIVENKPGAGGNIATQFVAQSTPDGLTFLVTSNNHTINPVLYKNAGYDAINDFMPVVQMTRGPSVIAVHPDFPAQSVADLIAISKNKSPIPFGSIGLGSAAHLVGECLKAIAGAKFEHVNYKGGAPAVADAVAGHIGLVISSTASTGQFIKSGKLRALGVSTTERWPSTPTVLTLQEMGYGECTSEAWIGLFAPKGTPQAIVEMMNKEILGVINSPATTEKIISIGYLPGTGSPLAFGNLVKKEISQVTQLVRQSKIQVQD